MAESDINKLIAKFKERANDAPKKRSGATAGYSEVDDDAFQSNASADSQVDETADVVVLTALMSPEMVETKKAFGSTFQSYGKEGHQFWLTQTAIGGIDVRVALGCQNSMGMVSAAILASKALRAWRPRLLVMTGICAGVRGKVNLGDLVIAKQVFDYGTGKLVKGRLTPDYEPVTLDDQLTSYAFEYTAASEELQAISNKWVGPGKPKTVLSCHVGAMASGAAVVADDSVVNGIVEHKRSLLAVDMESYAVARTAVAALPNVPFLIVKGVQDFADEEKSDNHRDYAAFASAQFVRRFLEINWKRFGIGGEANR